MAMFWSSAARRPSWMTWWCQVYQAISSPRAPHCTGPPAAGGPGTRPPLSRSQSSFTTTKCLPRTLPTSRAGWTAPSPCSTKQWWTVWCLCEWGSLPLRWQWYLSSGTDHKWHEMTLISLERALIAFVHFGQQHSPILLKRIEVMSSLIVMGKVRRATFKNYRGWAMTYRTAQILPLSCHLGMLARGLMGQRAGRPLAGTGALPIPRIWPLCAMSLDTPMGEATTIMIRKEGIIMAMRKQNPFWEEIT